MNEFFIVMSFFIIAFFGSLIYLAKSKEGNLISYLLNLNIEYVFIGILIYLIFSGNLKTNYDFIPYLFFLNVFVGILMGAQFRYSLLIKISYKYYFFLIFIYLLTHFSLLLIYSFFTKESLALAIITNTTFPYSCILLNKILKNRKINTHNNLILLSLYPLLSFLVFSFYQIKRFNTEPITIVAFIIFTLLIIGKTLSLNDKRAIYTMNILIIIIITGLSMTFHISPVVTGFISGLIIANTKLGDVFLNTISFIDKFIYIIIFAVSGIFIAKYFNSINIYMLIYPFLILITFWIIRNKISNTIFKVFVFQEKNQKVNLTNIGITPIIFIIDIYLTKEINLLQFIFPTILLFILLEITNFMDLKNEVKH